MAKEQTNVAMTETMNGNLVLRREPVIGKNGKQLETKDGRPYYNYVVRGVVRGREMCADFVPKDQGGYEPLDFLFSIADKLMLVINKEERVEADGRKVYYDTYTAQAVDENGEVWSCDLRPQRNSDKAILTFLVQGLNNQKVAE